MASTHGGSDLPGGRPPPGPGVLVVARAEGNGRVQLRVIGELDIATGAELDRAIDSCLREGHWEIVLDLADLTFVDAAGLRVLVRARRGLKEAGGRLELTNLRPFVRRVLMLTGLTEYLGVAPEGLGAAPEDGDASAPGGRP